MRFSLQTRKATILQLPPPILPGFNPARLKTACPRLIRPRQKTPIPLPAPQVTSSRSGRNLRHMRLPVERLGRRKFHICKLHCIRQTPNEDLPFCVAIFLCPALQTIKGFSVPMIEGKPLNLLKRAMHSHCVLRGIQATSSKHSDVQDNHLRFKAFNSSSISG